MHRVSNKNIKRRLEIKTRTFVIILILVLAILIITDSSATASDTELFLQAVKRGDVAEVKKLIDEGTDVNAQNKEGYTALIWASNDGHTEIVELLEEAGAVEYFVNK